VKEAMKAIDMLTTAANLKPNRSGQKVPVVIDGKVYTATID
jgi:hypothetical protein